MSLFDVETRSLVHLFIDKKMTKEGFENLKTFFPSDVIAVMVFSH